MGRGLRDLRYKRERAARQKENRHGYDDPGNGNANKVGEDVDNTGIVADYRGLNEFPAHAHKKSQHGGKPNARVAGCEHGENEQHSHGGNVRRLGQGIGDCLKRNREVDLWGTATIRSPVGSPNAGQSEGRKRQDAKNAWNFHRDAPVNTAN